ncbi:hypothetical protein F2Q65_12940 [Thiohalocapsa marina]|uniref:Uncharacterized protein n=1 Tax=Thiohalocapsa marina TaxID=424902 RepID=A0A5M8FHL2_9GAMM|nr:hypothetical protein [Thiohalocapsa marina]KAA6184217.1 hypothetical protein F2Q65_12940 [Thiohalocapsa marina]
MHVTDEQLLDFRAAIRRSDPVTQQHILETAREQNTRECSDKTDHELRRLLLYRVARILSET